VPGNGNSIAFDHSRASADQQRWAWVVPTFSIPNAFCASAKASVDRSSFVGAFSFKNAHGQFCFGLAQAVRTQLASVFEKTQTHRQAELVALLAVAVVNMPVNKTMAPGPLRGSEAARGEEQLQVRHR